MKGQTITRRGLIVIRVSSTPQLKNASPESQELACRAIAKAEGLEVIGVLTDAHGGDDLWERPRMMEAMGMIERREIDALIAYEVGRLTRDQDHLGVIRAHCRRYGVTLLFAMKEYENTAVGRAMMGLDVFANQHELGSLTDRSQRGKIVRTKERKLLPATPRPRYGYRFATPDKGRYEEDPDTADVVRRVFADVVAGKSIRSIAHALDTEKVPTPHGAPLWSSSTLQNMLKDDKYIGKAVAFRWQRVKINGRKQSVPRPVSGHYLLPEGTVPPLVKEELFAIVQERLRRNQLMFRRPPYDDCFLLRGGFLVCGNCGRALSVDQEYHSPSGRRVGRRYVSTPLHNQHCPWRLSITAEAIDEAVWAKVSEYLANPELIAAELVKQPNEDPYLASIIRLDNRLDEVERQCRRLARRVASTDSDAVAHLLEEELEQQSQRLQALQTEKVSLEEQRMGWQAQRVHLSSLENLVRDVAEGRVNGSIKEKREALEALKVRVRLFRAIDPDRYELTMNLDPSLTLNRGMLSGTSSGSGQHPPLSLIWTASQLGPLPPLLPELTERQRYTLMLLTAGQSTRMIAESLQVNQRTVDAYLHAALGRLGVSTRSEAMALARSSGLIVVAESGEEVEK